MILGKIIKLIQDGSGYRDYKINKNMLTKGRTGENKIVLTEDLARDVINEIHLLYGHLQLIERYKCRKIFYRSFFYPESP